MEEACMEIDPSSFHPVNVTDTCAVWNVLSSLRLYAAAKAAGCDFCMTAFVYYECLIKKRGEPKETDKTLMERLRRAQRDGAFVAHASTIADLQRVAQLEQRKKLGKGELSSIAFAMKIGQAVMTDDQRARRLAHEVGHAPVQTTPHLFGWLFFAGKLVEADKGAIIQQHVEMGQILKPHLERAYGMAMNAIMMKATPKPTDLAE
jgi:predicted nucleic acid-binding protein